VALVSFDSSDNDKVSLAIHQEKLAPFGIAFSEGTNVKCSSSIAVQERISPGNDAQGKVVSRRG
jgi:hypothetical protein